MNKWAHTFIVTIACTAACVLAAFAPASSAAESIGEGGGLSQNSGVISPVTSSSNNNIAVDLSAAWSQGESGAVGIDVGISISGASSFLSGESPVQVDAVLAEGVRIEDAALADTLDSWNAAHAGTGLVIEGTTSWVRVAEDGAQSSAEQDDDGALQALKLVMASQGGASLESTDAIEVTIPLALSDDASARVLEQTDQGTARQPVFFDAATSVMDEDGVVSVQTVPGFSLTVGDVEVQTCTPNVLCNDLVREQTASRSSRAVSDAPWYIDAFTLDSVYSGTAQFDGDDEPGHDSSARNDVLRSYDSVIYSTSYALMVEDGVGTAQTGKLRVSATLPLSDDLMTWDLDSMLWLKNAEVTTIAGKQRVTGDVVFGGESSIPVAPSVGMLNFVAKVRDVSQDQEIAAPYFSVQRYADDGHSLSGDEFECGTVNGVHQSTPAKNADLKGSAKGRFNAQLKAEDNNNRYTLTLQMRSESGGLKGMALPDEGSLIEVDFQTDWGQNLKAVKVNALGEAQSGSSPWINRVLGEDDYGVTAPFGMQPDGSHKTSFNTIYDSGAIGVKEYKNDTGNGTPATFTFQIGAFNIDKQNIDKVSANFNASRTEETKNPDYDSEVVYNFGSYLFEVEAPQYGYDWHTTWVEITELRVEDTGGAVSGDCYAEDDKCSQIHSPGAPVEGDHGFHINYNTTIINGYTTERIEDDGSLTVMNSIPDGSNLDGGSHSGIYEVSPGESFVTASQNQYHFLDDDATSYFSRLDAPRYVTKFMKFDDEVFEVNGDMLDEVPIESAVFSQDSGWLHHGDAETTVKYVTKPGGWSSDEELLTTHLDNDHATHFEDKPTGSLSVHSSYEDAIASGDPIVGVVYDILVDKQMMEDHFAYQKTGYRVATSLYVQIRSVPMRIKMDAAVRDGEAITKKDDPRLVGILTWDSTTSCVDLYRTETNALSGKTEYVNTYAYRRRSGTTTTLGKWQWAHRSGLGTFSDNIFTGYKKAEFDASGNVSKMAESAALLNGGYDNTPAAGGASFYVRLNGVDVKKEVAQQSEGLPKVNFNLDEGQRRVDFSIDAQHTGSDLSRLTDTVTLTDTIPAGMNPVNPEGTTPEERWSIAYGGVYRQDGDTNGGAGGEWVASGSDIVSTDASDTEAWKTMQSAMDRWAGTKPTLSYTVDEQANDDGSTTLTWTFNNVPVSYNLPKIHYSVKLGSADDPFKDLANGDSLANTVSASLAVSGAADSSSATVAVVRSQSAAVIKTPKVEQRNAEGTDPMGFDITFMNNADDDTAPLQLLSVVDILPGADDGSWSTTAEGIRELEDYKLKNVSFNAAGFPEGQSLYMAYMIPGNLSREEMRAMQKEGTLRGSMSNIDYGQDGWLYERIDFNADGSLVASSKQAVENTLAGREILAIGFFTLGTTPVPPGAVFNLSFDYGWDDARTELLHNTSDTFTNTVTLEAHALKKAVSSKATTEPTPADVDFSFTKIDGDSTSAPLAGAEFKLFKWSGGGDAPQDGLLDVENPGSSWELVQTQESAEDTGLVSFAKLKSGVYRLVETKAPAGYFQPTGQWNVTVDTLDEENPISITAVADGTTMPPAFAVTDSGSWQLPNYRPMDIPHAGGRGIAMFVAVGVAVSAIGFVVRTHARRRGRL